MKYLFIIILFSTILPIQAKVNIGGDSTLTNTDIVALGLSMNEAADSLKLEMPKANFQTSMNSIMDSRIYKMTSASVPLIISGLIIQSEKDQFRSLRNSYVPEFRYHYDDYLQYLPAAAMLGLKIAGVKGRSSWGRMIVSDAFSVALMAASVNLIKSTSKVMRPDDSNNHSFPSGHTATAFMCATMLHKEYGCVSPWYSIGGYVVATATGVSRILNNKHWISDVLVGAGIGILSTELGYFFADLIFKGKGLNEFPLEVPFDRYHKPSYLGLYMGFNLACNSQVISDKEILKLGTGANAGIEGAYFFNPYIGAGGRFNVSSMPVSINDVPEAEFFDMMSISIGPYFSYPICSQIHVGIKALGGYVDYPKCGLSTLTIGDKGSALFSTGASINIFGGRNFNLRFFADYNVSQSVIQNSNESLQYLTVGSVAAITF